MPKACTFRRTKLHKWYFERKIKEKPQDQK